MGVGAGLYMYDVVVKSSRSLFHLLMSSCLLSSRYAYYALRRYAVSIEHAGGDTC